MKIITSDVLVIGGGSAATRAAIEAAKTGVKVVLADKGRVSESGSSPRALVGFSILISEDDSAESYLQDWLKASGGISDHTLAMTAIKNSKSRAESAEQMGINFIKNPDGSWFLSQRAGHSGKRTLMVKDHANTIEVFRKEVERQGVEFCEGVLITRLLKNKGQVNGALGVDAEGNPCIFNAKAVVLAAGGANRIYPNLAEGMEPHKYRTTGDSFALSFYADAPIVDMEFGQFRDSPPAGPIFNAIYVNNLGERIMEKYDPVALEKAPRYMMAKAVYTENKEGRGPVVWHVEENQVAKSRAPVGLNYKGGDVVEIVLQFQRLMGGAHINTDAATRVPGLYAAGESSGGVMGGDRMQGCGFVETQVFGGIAGQSAAAFAQNNALLDIDQDAVNGELARLTTMQGVTKGAVKDNADPNAYIKKVQNLMWEKVGVVTNKTDLKAAITALEILRKDEAQKLDGSDIFSRIEAENLALTAELIARAKLAREETRSAHNRSDFPASDDNWIKHVCLTRKGDDVQVSSVPIATL